MVFETDPEGHVVNDFIRWECVSGDGNIGCAGNGDLMGVAASRPVSGVFSSALGRSTELGKKPSKLGCVGWDSDMEETRGSQNITQSLNQMGVDREVSG